MTHTVRMGIIYWSMLALNLVSSVHAASAIAPDTVKAFTFFADYYRSEPVVFGITNNTDKSIPLQSSAPWQVQNVRSGKIVYSPIALPMVSQLQPGETQYWSWDQSNNLGNPVLPGRYRIIFSGGKLTGEFEVRAKPGSKGFFTFAIAGDTLRLQITEPYAIRDAIDNYYGLNLKHIPVGALVDDRPMKSPFDPQWSWHLDPGSITMAEVTIELCDGAPAYVEENLDYWLNTVGTYCPWSAKIISLD